MCSVEICGTLCILGGNSLTEHPCKGVSDYMKMNDFDVTDNCLSFLQVDNVRLLDPIKKNKAVVGTLHLTTTHLIFIDPHGAKETWVSLIFLEFPAIFIC